MPPFLSQIYPLLVISLRYIGYFNDYFKTFELQLGDSGDPSVTIHS
jgi:hypothetical protein